jgi:hypothetical protein
VESLKRGYDDGNYASCSDAGVLTLRFTDGNPRRTTGYSLRIVEGKFEENVIPIGYIMPSDSTTQNDTIQFIWLDGSKNYQEPIDFKIEVMAVSIKGVQSEPYILHVTHPGGSSR